MSTFRSGALHPARPIIAFAGLAALLIAATAFAAPAKKASDASAAVPAYITAAMQDPARAADRKDDERRQMAATLTFTGIKPGDTVLELMPGAGYWTRVFSQIVGSGGHVYTWWPDWPPAVEKYQTRHVAAWKKLVKTPHYANVSVLQEPAQVVWAPKQVDIVFTADNYHDLHNPSMGPVHMHAFDKAVYDALKPGGVFIIVDHMAPAGSGTSDTNTLHRIDPASVKKEVEDAGFVFDGSSDALINPKDPLTATVFDKSIRGHTSQFIFRFRKPKH